MLKKISKQIEILFKVSRPPFILFIESIFLIGFSLSGASWTPIAILQFILLSFPASVLLFGLNDVYDYESDLINPRKQGKAFGMALEKVNHDFVIKASYFFAILIFFSSVLTFNWQNILATSLILVVAIFYSVPPLRLKTRPPFELILNVLGAYSLGFVGYTHGSTVEHYFTTSSVNVLAAIFFWILGIALVSYLADFDSDKLAGHITTVILLGKRTTLVLIVINYIICGMLVYNQRVYNLMFLAFVLIHLWLVFNPSNLNTRKVYYITASTSAIVILLNSILLYLRV